MRAQDAPLADLTAPGPAGPPRAKDGWGEDGASWVHGGGEGRTPRKPGAAGGAGAGPGPDRAGHKMKVAFLAGHLAGKATFSPEQHPRQLDAAHSKSGSGFPRRFFKIFPGAALR
ncbi:hypothetical protein GCM10010517_54260 [Streptosporangium fragile]|uniref:Uncharacterized protein n=1 Tax=Streptosporangium fragile TaxID=46186 RepID=A0ABP6IK21_9ACTN